ncbi:hypothetical protein SDC9_143782 [bioreactor metagenome]|uniref:Uncharacterized protein n=1 Tax=bioreactor metagenome TaxID=1076179 RepID=A0A645E4H3_9ZZZZ
MMITTLRIVQCHINDTVIFQCNTQRNKSAVMPYLPIAPATALQQHLGAWSQITGFYFIKIIFRHHRAHYIHRTCCRTCPNRLIETLPEKPSTVQRSRSSVGVMFKISRIFVGIIKHHRGNIFRIYSFICS